MSNTARDDNIDVSSLRYRETNAQIDAIDKVSLNFFLHFPVEAKCTRAAVVATQLIETGCGA